MDPTTLGRIRRGLLAWYDENRRELPWRAGPGDSADPYAVWVSEVMLQQTRVDTVRGYYERWMKAFPTLESLAAAPEDTVLKAWEGLGYYARARNLHRAVREVAMRYGGEVPGDFETFSSLPGVGRYTAGAVGSIAFGRETPVVDGNVRRVFARLVDEPDPPPAELWSLAADLVVGPRPGDLNQALMELGATVCKPRTPLCADCPVSGDCGAFSAGTVDERPVRKLAKEVPVEHHGVAVVLRGGRALLAKRPVGGRLAGMWEFPGVARTANEEVSEAAARAVTGLTGVRAGMMPLCRVEHAFTHVRVIYEAFLSRGGPASERPAAPDRAWVALTEIEAYPLPRAQQRIAAALRALVGQQSE